MAKSPLGRHRTGWSTANRPRATTIRPSSGGRNCSPPWPDTRPPCRTVVGLFPRRYENHSYDESDPEYVPDSPPKWARVVDIG
ncbi:hypothetical protein ABTX62_00555 [Streptomyces sp. NPDC096046]|uniref:hypothetical protein n=1 Tax=Streptomyces sp. NPDC096046 TaxID=3155542 RepID=UPI0033239EAE